jgi:hypothetical protein
VRRRVVSGRRGRGSGGGRSWLLVALSLGLAALPAGPRALVRDRLLDLHVRLMTLTSGAVVASGPAGAAGDDAQTRALQAENLRLRRALQDAGAARELVADTPRARLIPADALPLAGGDELLRRVALARGRQDGVREGQAVLTRDGLVLVGVVARVTATTCEVRLVTDPTFVIHATISRAGGEVEGLLRGDGSDALSFCPAILDPAAPAPLPQVGETVLCSRASGLCGVPAVLGVVASVDRAPGTGLPRARVRLVTDVLRLGSVVILRGPEGEASK